jgi:hypothetical protein
MRALLAPWPIQRHKFRAMIKIKPRIHLLGKHSNRTPLSYAPYRHIAAQYFTYTNSVFDADFIVFGFSIDIQSHAFLLGKAIELNPSLKVVVLSEEPVWITLWSEYKSNRAEDILIDSKSGVSYRQISCLNSDIYSNLVVPYFITTDDSYLARYRTLFYRNSLVGSRDLLNSWKTRKYRFAYIGEARAGKLHDLHADDVRGYPLSAYRTQLASLVRAEKLLLGVGWDNTHQRRQELPDWHISKLASLYQCSMYVSAIENTYCSSYVTEKPFDALASLSIPIVWTAGDSCLYKYINPTASFNVYGQSPHAAAEAIERLDPSEDNAHSIIDCSMRLCKEVMAPANIQTARRLVVSRIRRMLEDM